MTAKCVKGSAAANGDESSKAAEDRKGSAAKKRSWPRRLRNFVESATLTFLIFLLGICFRGEWLLILVHFSMDHDGKLSADLSNSSVIDERSASDSIKAGSSSWHHLVWETPYLRQYCLMWLAAVGSSFVIYFGVCGSLHWYFYVQRHDRSEEWKCQPNKWLSPKAEKSEICLGVCSLLCVDAVTALLATYLMNGGPSMVYYRIDEYTWLWWFLQFPVVYVIIDYITYWFHRLYHFPTMYKMFHKLHHTWKQPTAWSATAIHPVEIVHLWLIYISVLFIMPIHLFSFIAILIYCFYHGMLDHSGIDFKAEWWQPWQPDASFHDQHHEFTHVNFGFNMFLWDKLYGTERQANRIYNEDVFYGRGKPLSQATKEELELYYREYAPDKINNRNIRPGEKTVK